MHMSKIHHRQWHIQLQHQYKKNNKKIKKRQIWILKSSVAGRMNISKQINFFYIKQSSNWDFAFASNVLRYIFCLGFVMCVCFWCSTLTIDFTFHDWSTIIHITCPDCLLKWAKTEIFWQKSFTVCQCCI